MVRIITIYVAGSVLGVFAGRFLLGHLTEYMSWRRSFEEMAALNLIGTAEVWRGLPASRHFVANSRLAANLATLGKLVRNPSLQTACALVFTVLFAQIGLFTFVNLHLAAAPYYFSSGDLANIFAVYLLGMAVTPLAGGVIPRIGIRHTILLSVATSALGVLLTLVHPVWGIVAALAIAACGTFVTQSATMSFIAYRIPSGRSLASGDRKS